MFFPKTKSGAARSQVIIIALITAACVAVDAMLYVVLPIHWQEAGLTSIWQVGILLSLNRLVRLPLNPVAGWCFSKVRAKTLIMLSTILALCVSAGYTMANSFAMWAALRILWGIVWSFLKLGGLFTVMDVSDDSNRGCLMGIYTGTYRLGSLAGMLGGGVIADIFGLKNACICGIALSASAILLTFAKLQRRSPSQKESISPKKHSWKDIAFSGRFIKIIASCLAVSLVIEGFLAATLSAYLQFQAGKTIVIAGIAVGCAAAAGGIQSLRWAWNPLLSPVIGRISDSSSNRGKLFCCCCCCSAVLFFLAAIQMPLAPLLLLLLGIELCSTALTTLADALAADLASGSQTVFVITAYTFASDLGAALGPVGGYALINFTGILPSYAVAGISLAFMALIWSRHVTKQAAR